VELTRRVVVAGALASCAAPPSAVRPLPFEDAVRDLEARAGGQLGVALLVGEDPVVGHRLDERFALCSTFKLPLVAAILEQVERGDAALDEFVPFGEADLVPHAPVVEERLAQGGAPLQVLLEAAQKLSDNAAANLLLRRVGGPEGFTAILRRWGDPTTRLDRWETELNVVGPGEEHDTTTPAAMARLVRTVLFGEVLTPASRERLIGWMVDTQTGAARLRAGVPAGWRAGDKMGTASSEGLTNRVNDVAVVFPPDRTPMVIAAYYRGPVYSGSTRAEDQAVLAEVGRLACV
jgi:beta-lactamase class A